MAALFCSRDTITPFLTNYQQQVEIAAVNSPTQILVSGDKDAIARLCIELTAAKIDSHILTVSHAFHSYLMDDILSEFKTEAELDSFISNMTEYEYSCYQNAMKKYLESSRFAKFLPPAFADTIISTLKL